MTARVSPWRSACTSAIAPVVFLITGCSTRKARLAAPGRANRHHATGIGRPTATKPPGSACAWRTCWIGISDAAHLPRGRKIALCRWARPPWMPPKYWWLRKSKPSARWCATPCRCCTMRSSVAEMLFEGAQGILLDIDFGTYPYVTSSMRPAAARTGSAYRPTAWTRGGRAESYVTRVRGPFPTELHDATGEELRRVGNEFGATTGVRGAADGLMPSPRATP